MQNRILASRPREKISEGANFYWCGCCLKVISQPVNGNSLPGWVCFAIISSQRLLTSQSLHQSRFPYHSEIILSHLQFPMDAHSVITVIPPEKLKLNTKHERINSLGLSEARYFTQYPSFLQCDGINKRRNIKRDAAGEVFAAGAGLRLIEEISVIIQFLFISPRARGIRCCSVYQQEIGTMVQTHAAAAPAPAPAPAPAEEEGNGLAIEDGMIDQTQDLGIENDYYPSPARDNEDDLVPD